jgi:PhzF family phenazine biosynthesis protein
MPTIKMFQVDAFAERLFTGNPAAVCLLDEWPDNAFMQAVAAENNLAETAFLLPAGEDFEIRWFTPKVEVDLCGHATLASGFVLFHCLGYNRPEVRFHSPRSGALKVLREGEMLYLDFPTDAPVKIEDVASIQQCLNVPVTEVFRGKSDFLAVLENQAAVQHLLPDLSQIAALPARGLIVTAKGDTVDFVSRFFAPQCGIDEDPVTGSAHTLLIPLWAEKLGKSEMTARQLSQRGGTLHCRHQGKRCLIGGTAQLYLAGEIYLDQAGGNNVSR